MLIGQLPEDTTVSDDGFLLYSEDGVHALKIKKKNAFDSGMTVYYGIADPEDIVGLRPKDGDIYFKLNGATLSDSTAILRIYVYVNGGVGEDNEAGWVPSNFSNTGTVEWEQIYRGGEQIASITIDGYTIPVYAPNGGTQITISNLLASGVEVATITLDGTNYSIKVPSSQSGAVTDVVMEYTENGQTVDTSILDGAIAKLKLDINSLSYNTTYGLTINMRMSNSYQVIQNVDLSSDNYTNNFTFPAVGIWMVSCCWTFTLSSAYQTNDPTEYLYIKPTGNCFEDGNIEERVPMCVCTDTRVTLMVEGIAIATENNTTFIIHVGGNLANPPYLHSASIFYRAFRLGG